MKYAKALQDLKKFLQRGENFKNIFEQFFTLTETSDFLDEGEAEKDLILGKIIMTVLESVLGKLYRLDIRMVVISEYHFIHGAIMVNDTQGSFFFYKDIRMGLVAVYDKSNNETKFIRLSGDIIPMDGFIAAKGSESTH